MSRPNIDTLGICAELTLHEKALRKAQHEIDELRAENARLREELRIARAGTALHPQNDRILCGDPLLRQQQAMAPIMSSFADEQRTAFLAQNPPHHSAIGTRQDIKG